MRICNKYKQIIRPTHRNIRNLRMPDCVYQYDKSNKVIKPQVYKCASGNQEYCQRHTVRMKEAKKRMLKPNHVEKVYLHRIQMWLVSWLAEWLAGWLAGWLARWLTGWQYNCK
uniref:Uncharacterized protein n=1 Tax=Glossina brevipalpis TaxID=37001 RepID=A0A1A9W0K1_9MUSC